MKALKINNESDGWVNKTLWATCPDCGWVKATPHDGMRYCPHCGKGSDHPWVPGVWCPKGTLVVAEEEVL